MREKTVGAVKAAENRFEFSEAINCLRTNILLTLPVDEHERRCRIIGVTSAQPQEGKSVVAAELARSFAALGKRVLLVDADMRNGFHGETGGVGLSAVLSGECDVAAAVRKGENGDVFARLPAGDRVSNPSELLHSARFEQLLQTLRAEYDYVIADFPAVCAVADAAAAAGKLDGVVVVTRQGVCRREALCRCVEQLCLVDAKLLGFAVTDARD